MKVRKGTLAVFIATETAVLSMAALAMSQDNSYARNGAVLGALIMTLPLVLEKAGWFRMPMFMQAWASAAVTLHTFGLVLGLYDDTWWWDEVTHFVSSSMVGMVAALALFLFDIHSMKIKVPRWAYPLMILVFSIFIGVVWEIAEFTGDALAMTGMQYSLEDTLGDLYVDILGGVATSLIWVLWVWRDADGELAASAQGTLIELFGRVF
jgi:hypothetical protein